MTSGDTGIPPVGQGEPESGEATHDELAALMRAMELAATPGVPLGPNPRVGCVLLDALGRPFAEGYHRGAGTAHAEVAALAAARARGAQTAGATAVVTLEPCNHHGRTGPCSQALIEAGIRRVVFGQPDPNPLARGGAERLRAAGLSVVGGFMADAAAELNPQWNFAVTHGRPFVTWKVAATLDGRVAAADGSSRWITSPEARADVHVLRAQVQAVIVGTGTVLADDPSLTVRDAHGALTGPQPLRVVIGRREVPAGARLRDGAAPMVQFSGADLEQALVELGRREIRHALLEGGPTLAAAFLNAGLVDRIRWYLAPAILGSGPSAVADLGVRNIAGMMRARVVGIRQVGADVVVEAVPGSQPVVDTPARVGADN